MNKARRDWVIVAQGPKKCIFFNGDGPKTSEGKKIHANPM